MFLTRTLTVTLETPLLSANMQVAARQAAEAVVRERLAKKTDPRVAVLSTTFASITGATRLVRSLRRVATVYDAVFALHLSAPGAIQADAVVGSLFRQAAKHGAFSFVSASLA